MRRAQFRLFLLCFLAVMNFVPLLATAQVPGKMWYVWRKVGECSLSRNDWLSVAQESPGPGWVVCNGSKFHFTQLGAQQEMDILKVVQCGGDMPNCPRFQNNCCEVKIWQNTQTGATTIMKPGESPGFGWQLSALNSATQCCEEAALLIGSLQCRRTQLNDGVIAIFQGPGVFTNEATGATISPATLPEPSATITPPGQIEPIPDDTPIVVNVDPEIELDDYPQPPKQPQPPADKPPAPTTSINPDWPGVYVRGACTFNVAPSGQSVSVNFQCTDGGNGTLFNCNTYGSRASATCDYNSTDSAQASHKGKVSVEYTGDPQGRPEYQCLKLHFTEEEPNKGASWDVWCANRKT